MAGGGNERLQHKKGLTARQKAFLAAYAKCGNITTAAELVPIARKTHYAWMENPEYAEAFGLATEEAAQRLEAEARRRAEEGVEEPVFYKGKKCGVVTKYSDTLLIFLLKGAMPDKYKERTSTELTGAGGKDLRVEFVSPEKPGEAGGA